MNDSLYFDKRFQLLTPEDKRRVLRGELSLDNIVPFEGLEERYAATQAPPIPQAAPETTWGELAGGTALQAVRGAVGATRSGIDTLSRLSPANQIMGLVNPELESARRRSLNEAFQPGMDAATALMPDAYKSELNNQIVARNPDGSINWDIAQWSVPTAEQLVGTTAESLAYIPQVLAGGSGISKALTAAPIRKGLADFVGYGLANAGTVAPAQYFDTFNEVKSAELERGTPEVEANRIADVAANKAEKATAALSFVTGGAGMGLASTLGRGASTRLGGLAKGALSDMPFEGLEEGFQTKIAQTYGAGPMDNASALEAGILGAVTGAVPGGVVGFLETPLAKGMSAADDMAKEMGIEGEPAEDSAASVLKKKKERNAIDFAQAERDIAQRAEQANQDVAVRQQDVLNQLDAQQRMDEDAAPIVRAPRTFVPESETERAELGSFGPSVREQGWTPAMNEPLIEDMFSGKTARAPAMDAPIDEEVLSRTPERQAELERDYLFQKQELVDKARQEEQRKVRQAELKAREAALPTVDTADMTVAKQVADAAQQGRNPTMAAAFEQAGIRRAGGLLGDVVNDAGSVQKARDRLITEVVKAQATLGRSRGIKPRKAAQNELALAEQRLSVFDKESSSNPSFDVRSYYPDIRPKKTSPAAEPSTPSVFEPQRVKTVEQTQDQDLLPLETSLYPAAPRMRPSGSIDVPKQDGKKATTTPSASRKDVQAAAKAVASDVESSRKAASNRWANVPVQTPTVIGEQANAQEVRGDQGLPVGEGIAGSEIQGTGSQNLQRPAQVGREGANQPIPAREAQQKVTGRPLTEEESVAALDRGVAPLTAEEVSVVQGETTQQQRAARVDAARVVLADRKISGVTVVDSATGPSGRMDQATGTVEVNADAVEDPADIVAVATHEIGHALNTARDQGKRTSRRSLNNILGSENEARVNRRVELLAQSVPEMAEAVRRARRAAKNDKALYGKELLSYALEEITRATESGKATSPRIKTFVRDLVFLAKQALNKLGFSNIANTFNERDLYRLGKLMVKEFSEKSESRPTPGGQKKTQVLESQRRAAQPKAVASALGEPNTPEDTIEPVTVYQKPDSRVFSVFDEASYKSLPGGIFDAIRAVVEMGKGLNATSAILAKQASRNVERSIHSLPKEKRLEASRLVEVIDLRSIALNEAMDNDTTLRKVVDFVLSKKDQDGARAALTRPREKEALAQWDKMKDALKSAEDDLKAKFPAVHARLMYAKGRNRSLSLQMMQAIIGKGQALTPKEVNQLRRMRRQLNTYLTRQYRALAPDYATASTYIDSIAKAYEKFKKTGVATPLSQRFTEAMDYLKKNTLDIGSFIEMAEQSAKGQSEGGDVTDPKNIRYMTLDEFQELSNNWLPPDENVVPIAAATDEQKQQYFDDTIARLKAKKQELIDNGLYDSVLNNKAEQLTKEILGTAHTKPNTYAAAVRAVANNPSILMTRKNISPEIRALLGEITDPLIKLQATAQAQAQALAKMVVQDDLYSLLQDAGLIIPRSEVGKPGTAKLGTELKGDSTFGKLAGLYTTKDVATVLEGMKVVIDEMTPLELFHTITGKYGKQSEKNLWKFKGAGWSAVSSAWEAGMRLPQKIMVVYNPVIGASSNAISAFVQVALQNGFVYNPASKKHRAAFSKALGAATGTLLPERRKEFNRYAEEVVRQDLIDAASTADIQTEIRNGKARSLLRDVVHERGPRVEKMVRAWNALKSGAGAVDESLVWLTATSDRAFVYYAYFLEKEHLKEYYGALGKKVPDSQIELEAAAKIKDTNITPSRASEIIKQAQRKGLLAYGRFFYETYRSAATSAYVGFVDAKAGLEMTRSADAKQRAAGKIKMKYGMARFIGSIGALIASRVAIATLIRGSLVYGAASLLMGGDAGEEDDPFAKEENGWAKLQELGERDKNYIALGKDKDGNTYIADAGRFDTLETSAAPLVSALLQADPEKAVAQIRSIAFLNPAARAVASDVVVPMVTSGSPQMAKLAKDIGKSVTPRVVKNALETDVTDRNIPDAAKLAMAAGMYVNVFNPNDAFKYAWYKEIDATKKEARKNINEYVANAIKDGSFNEKDLLVKWAEANKQQAELWDRASEMVLGARMLGATDEQIQNSLDAQRVSKDVRNGLLDGSYVPMIVSSNSLEGKKQQVLSSESNEEARAKYEQGFDKAIELFDTWNQEYNTEVN